VQGKQRRINKIDNPSYLDTVEVIGSIPVAPIIFFFRDLDAQLEQFAVNSRRSPAHIISIQSPYKFASFFRNRWPTGLSVPNFPGPVPTEPESVVLTSYDRGRQRLESEDVSKQARFAVTYARDKNFERETVN